VYDKKQIFHFTQDGLTWDLTTDITGAFDLAAKVGAKRGKATYTFDVLSSEGLAVDAKGNLIGDKNVKLSRAMMYPKYGKAVACSAWAYSTKDGASFVCDDFRVCGEAVAIHDRPELAYVYQYGVVRDQQLE